MNILFFTDIIKTFSPSFGWGERSVLHKAYTVLVVGYFLALFPMSYEYYLTLRSITCVALFFFFQKLREVRNNYPSSYYGVIFLFVLFNPFIPVHTGSHIFWAIANILTLYFLYTIRQIFEGDNNTKI